MSEWFESINTSVDRLGLYAPVFEALLLVIGFLFLAKLSDLIISAIALRLTRRTKARIDDQLVARLHRPIFVTVTLIGVLLASKRLDLTPELARLTLGLIETLLVLIWLVFALRVSRLLIGSMRRQPRRFEFVQQSTEPLLTNAIAVLLFLAGSYAILLVWQIDVTALVASAGIVGLALSFAAQDTLANLFAGIAILTDQPYKIGDFIILDSGERGQVTKIGLRSTRLLTREDVEISIPNGVMGSAKIINEAGGPANQFRISATVGVAYGSDIDVVMEVLVGIAHDHAKVLEDPKPRARFRIFGNSSLDFDLLCWITNPADRGLVVHELNCEIYRQFATTGIQIPFPQRDVHIKQIPVPDGDHTHS
jgi:small-conductance mechanosensitive channel